MAMGKRPVARQASPLWVETADLPTSDGHPFFERLNRVLEDYGFDAFVEGLCSAFYAARMGRPSLRPGRYFRMLLIGYFEGLSSERGIAWRVADSLSLRSFLDLELTESAPDHSTLSRTRRLIDVETHDAPQLLPEEPSSFRLHHNGRARASAEQRRRRKRHPSRHQSPHQGRIHLLAAGERRRDSSPAVFLQVQQMELFAADGHDAGGCERVTGKSGMRPFATTTAGLFELSAWLTEAGCTQVAMEATGVYWKPLWHILGDEESFDAAARQRAAYPECSGPQERPEGRGLDRRPAGARAD